MSENSNIIKDFERAEDCYTGFDTDYLRWNYWEWLIEHEAWKVLKHYCCDSDEAVYRIGRDLTCEGCGARITQLHLFALQLEHGYNLLEEVEIE